MRPSRQIIAKSISDNLDKGLSSSAIAKQVAAYLLSEHRTNDINSIIRDVIALRASRGDVEAEVVTAHELEPKVRKDLDRTIRAIEPNAKNVIIDERVDPQLVGGFKLNVIDKSLDLSVRAKLNRLKSMTAQGGI